MRLGVRKLSGLHGPFPFPFSIDSLPGDQVEISISSFFSLYFGFLFIVAGRPESEQSLGRCGTCGCPVDWDFRFVWGAGYNG